MHTRPHPARGFTFIELLIAASVVLIAASAGVAFVLRSSSEVTWSQERVFAQAKALSILAELRAHLEGGEGGSAADLDSLDDGLGAEPALTIARDRADPARFVAPDDPLSGNVMDRGIWRWNRRITVRRFPGVDTRDLRICTVRMFRMRPEGRPPGEQVAEVSSVIRTVADAYPTTQVYDVYLLAIANVPGWWVYMDAIQSFVEATLTDLEARNPGLEFRTHWITKLGYGRDEEYAPYTNEMRTSTEETPWAYVYPGRMPEGQTAQRYYVAGRMDARVNLDGRTSPEFLNDFLLPEPYVDENGNGQYDPGERFTDVKVNGVRNGRWDANNPVPFALADMHNHCMRWPDAEARHAARVKAGLDDEDAPTWRLLLDRMVAEPDRYHNAILVNLHGELLPMPPARNVSDPAKDPEGHPGWRVVTHPERLRPARIAGDDVASQAPRFRVYAFKTAFPDATPAMPSPEPWEDEDRDGLRDKGEAYEDWNGNGAWDAGLPVSVVIRDGDFSKRPNAALDPSLVVRCLSGGVDADGNGTADPYQDWRDAPCYPETFADDNGDGIRQVAEPFLDLDGDGAFTATSEPFVDGNGNGTWDPARPAEAFDDLNGNARWDGGEPFWDFDGNGHRTPPPAPIDPWLPWDPAFHGNVLLTTQYLLYYGEPFVDLDGDGEYDAPEPVTADRNGNGVFDGGFARGEMWWSVRYEVAADRTVLDLYGTPLETPYLNDGSNDRKGLPASRRLYDLDYVPCPMPDTAAGADRFARDLFHGSADQPKNTARWTVELPLPAVREAFETAPGARDGDGRDRILAVETRLGGDLTTGVRWPEPKQPANVSRTYAYFFANPDDVPFSERFQFVGDPRHSPYADTDALGTTAAHGYNWFFDDLRNGTGDARPLWLAFDGNRLKDRWLGRGGGNDVPRLFQWLRQALTKTEAVYTTLTGWSYYYMSIGGDVGYDAANGFPDSIPMDGSPFGIDGPVQENTITSENGTSSLRGSRKLVRSNDGLAAGIRAGGAWWSKPWLGELYPDAAYAGQWRPWGNLRAKPGAKPGEYHLVRRSGVPSAQQPFGTTLSDAESRTKPEGCTSFFNIGTSGSTFHHQGRDGETGRLVEDGPQLAANYNFPIPTTASISRPFGLALSGSGGVGDEFAFTDAYPRYAATMVRRFYDHQSGLTGSGLVQLTEPGADPRRAFVVVTGLDRTLESGSAFIARYALLSLLHGFLAGGAPGTPARIAQLPRLQVDSPTIVTELIDPDTIDVRWSVRWTRWDGLAYTGTYPAGHVESESELVYVPLYSRDGGMTWFNMRDDSPAEPGRMPWIAGIGADPSRVLRDDNAGGDEVWTWATPPERFPEGTYTVRIEAYRDTEALHYAHHMEKIYVER